MVINNDVKILEEEDVQLDISATLPKEYLVEKNILPLKKMGKKITIAMENPKNTILIDELQIKTNMVVKPVKAFQWNIKELIEISTNRRYKKGESQTNNVLEELNKYAEEDIELEKNYEKDEDIVNTLRSDSAPVVKGVNAIIIKAIRLKASDIHIEPYEKEIRIRYRLDGLLIVVKKIPKHIINAIVSRIKIMSNLDISEKRLPQDGRFRIKISDRQVDFRVSTINTIYGEKVVMRILDRSSVKLDLQTLGFEPKDLEVINKIIKNPYGIILVTGPTGAGKSTTLYSILNKLNKENLNISTAEDPVEFELDGINQIQCKPEIGLDFATTLRSFLRQDPDIIMVGEVRDKETAEISIKAALTGHLVLSTLHTNDAPTSIQRLLNMSIEPFLVSASLSMVIAQRLVRKICNNCVEDDRESELKLKTLGINSNDVGMHPFKIGKGCEKCNQTGYRGRTVIYEIMVVDDSIKNIISKQSTVSTLRKAAIEKGMKPLKKLGLEKAKKGITTLDEIIRVTLS